MLWLERKRSGKKVYAVLTASEPKLLEKMARVLKAAVHGKGSQARHLDLSGHRINLAKRYGAREKE